MNAIATVRATAPTMTEAGLLAVVRALPPLRSIPARQREVIEAALAVCAYDPSIEDADCEIFAYQANPFVRQPGEAGFVEETVDDGYYPNPNFDDQEAHAQWIALRQAGGAQPDAWGRLLSAVERFAPGFSLPSASPLQLLSLDDDEAPEIAWTVAGLVQERSICAIVGTPGEGKTTLALSLALHIAAGRSFAGRPVLQGAVVYVAAEGHLGALQARLRAMKAEYGMTGPLPLRLIGGVVNLLRPAEVDNLVSAIADGVAGPVRAVIFDTLPRCMVGGDENSALAMGQAVASLARIAEATGAAAMVLTHPARGGSEARGSSALEGALDTRVNVSASRDGAGAVKTVALKVGKQRNGQDGDRIVFEMKTTPAALVPIFRNDAPAPVATPAPMVSAKAILALAFLAKHGPMPEAAWRAGVAGQLTPSDDAGTQRQAFYRVRDELSAAGAAEAGDKGGWRATP